MMSIDNWTESLKANKARLLTTDKYKTPYTYIAIVENIIDIQHEIIKLQCQVKENITQQQNLNKIK